MALESYSATRPALRYRGWLAAGALLLVSTGLAVALTRSRTSGILSPRLAPVGWEMSYRVPRDFRPSSQAENGNLYRYLGLAPDGEPVELSFWRMPVRRGEPAERVAERVLQDGDAFSLRILFGRAVDRSAKRMGGRAAVELQDAGIPMIARATVLPSGEGYAVGMKAAGSISDPATYHLLESVCREISFSQ